MPDTLTISDPTDLAAQLNGLLTKQKQAFMGHPMPDLKTRVRRLDKLHNAIVDYHSRLIEAVNADFSNRSTAETN